MQGLKQHDLQHGVEAWAAVFCNLLIDRQPLCAAWVGVGEFFLGDTGRRLSTMGGSDYHAIGRFLHRKTWAGSPANRADLRGMVLHEFTAYATLILHSVFTPEKKKKSPVCR